MKTIIIFFAFSIPAIASNYDFSDDIINNFPLFFIHIGIDYVPAQENYWSELLKDYNYPKSDVNEYLVDIGLTVKYTNFLIKYNKATALFVGSNTINDRSSKISQSLDEVKFAYNIFRKNGLVSPIIGFRIYTMNHTISNKETDLSLEEFMSFPNIYLELTQLSGIVGLNYLTNIFSKAFLEFQIAYTLNISEFSELKSNRIKIENPLGSPIDSWYLRISLAWDLSIAEKGRK